jgi:hypothetical protein
LHPGDAATHDQSVYLNLFQELASFSGVSKPVFLPLRHKGSKIHKEFFADTLCLGGFVVKIFDACSLT